MTMTAARLAKLVRSGVLRRISSRQLSHTRMLASPRLEAELTAPNGTRWTQPLGLFIDNQFRESVEGDVITTSDPLYVYLSCSWLHLLFISKASHSFLLTRFCLAQHRARLMFRIRSRRARCRQCGSSRSQSPQAVLMVAAVRHRTRSPHESTGRLGR